MYLNRMPKYKNATPKDVVAVDNFLDYIKSQMAGNHCTFNEWCGMELTDVNLEFVEFYSNHYAAKYGSWDIEKKYPWYRVGENVGYWRKANQIHNWMVNNIQAGIDDCGTYEVTKENIKKLLNICRNIKALSILEDGKIIINQDIAETLLPTTHGFFFGGTDYDEYYMQDIEDTIKILEKVLAETDFEKEMIAYCSSW